MAELGNLAGSGLPAKLDANPAVFPGDAEFQHLRLRQYMRSPDGAYQHLDISIIGLVAAAGVWREARVKIFDRGGISGLEFRKIKGWPSMFDIWPADSADRFGPFWRLEAPGMREGLSRIGSRHNYALVKAIIQVLPAMMHTAAELANLSKTDMEAWAGRIQVLVKNFNDAADRLDR